MGKVARELVEKAGVNVGQLVQKLVRAPARSSPRNPDFHVWKSGIAVVGGWTPDEWRASASAAGGDCANGKARMGS